MSLIPEPNVPQISVEEVKASIDAHEDIILLDVRTVGECSRGKLAGSINVPLDELMNQIEVKIPDKSAKIYVYCLSGSRSIHAVDTMLKVGYTDVFNMTGGLLAWRAKGYKI